MTETTSVQSIYQTIWVQTVTQQDAARGKPNLVATLQGNLIPIATHIYLFIFWNFVSSNDIRNILRNSYGGTHLGTETTSYVYIRTLLYIRTLRLWKDAHFSHTTIIHPILRRLATPHIKLHFQFSSVWKDEVLGAQGWRTSRLKKIQVCFQKLADPRGLYLPPH